jgi:hypothetical protein
LDARSAGAQPREIRARRISSNPAISGYLLPQIFARIKDSGSQF